MQLLLHYFLYWVYYFGIMWFQLCFVYLLKAYTYVFYSQYHHLFFLLLLILSFLYDNIELKTFQYCSYCNLFNKVGDIMVYDIIKLRKKLVEVQNKLDLLVDKENPSIFVKELIYNSKRYIEVINL